MSPLTPEKISKESEQTMREWVENYHPVRQRTVRSETTKDKAEALPSAVYSKTTNYVSKVDFSEEINDGDHNEEERDFPDTLTQIAVQITFVDEDKITVARSASLGSTTGGIDEHDSDTDFNEVSEGPVKKVRESCTCLSSIG